MTSTRLLLLSWFIALLSGFPALQAQNSYGPQFLWGAAISAHQVEGTSGGGQYSDWYLFEHTNHNILNGDTADVATDHWHRYAQDFAIAATIVVNAIRTSVAWKKIEPTMGAFSSDAISHYRTEFQTMRALGFRPMITLLHGTTPIITSWVLDESFALICAIVSVNRPVPLKIPVSSAKKQKISRAMK